MVDFSMFDFIIATTQFSPDDMTSDLKMLQRFWVTIYPYVDNVIGNLNHYKLKFREIYGVEGQTLKTYALQNLELQCHRKFLKDMDPYCCDNTEESFELLKKFEKFHADFKAESDAEIVKIKAREDKRNLEIEEKQKKREEIEKKRAFQASLRF